VLTVDGKMSASVEVNVASAAAAAVLSREACLRMQETAEWATQQLTELTASSQAVAAEQQEPARLPAQGRMAEL